MNYDTSVCIALCFLEVTVCHIIMTLFQWKNVSPSQLMDSRLKVVFDMPTVSFEIYNLKFVWVCLLVSSYNLCIASMVSLIFLVEKKFSIKNDCHILINRNGFYLNKFEIQSSCLNFLVSCMCMSK